MNRQPKTNNDKLSYVLITPARNEAQYIEQTIKSVISQTVLPLRWVIVSDGSTDRTDEIVQEYLSDYPWMEFVRTPEREERHFAGKVMAFNAGYDRVKNLPYDIIGSLDADITFDGDFFAFLLEKFANNDRLGVAGTPFKEGSFQYDYRYTSIEHVSGACQLFRKDCFEAIGGYTPIEGGGIDLVAVLTARMIGWETRSFPDKHCIHHRKMGSANFSRLRTRFVDGKKDYNFGAHPLWEIFRALYQMRQKPYIIGGFTLFCGYLLQMIRGINRPISNELVSFRRKEQMLRLKRLFISKT